MGSRNDTTFETVPGFVRDHDSFSIDEQASIDRYINRFEDDYQKSIMDLDLRNGYEIEVFLSNPYKVWQIRLKRTYRAFIMFHDEQSRSYWIALFRKGKRREQREITVALKRARDLWDQIKER